MNGKMFFTLLVLFFPFFNRNDMHVCPCNVKIDLWWLIQPTSMKFQLNHENQA